MPQTYTQALSHFTSFLTCYVHTLLYLRSIYPSTTFVTSRFHNTSVHQSRHPSVCEWITDAVTAVHTELLAGTVTRIGIVIYHLGGERGGSPNIMERFMLDVGDFPVVEKRERDKEIEWERDPLSPASSSTSDDDEDGDGEQESSKQKGKGKADLSFDKDLDVNMSEQYRAALISLHTRCSRLKALPKGCSFNICMELRDDPEVDPPIRHPQAWIPAQESLQKTGRKGTANDGQSEQKSIEGQDLGGVKITPIRTVQTGVFRFETWVEEGKAKFEVKDSQTSASTAST